MSRVQLRPGVFVIISVALACGACASAPPPVRDEPQPQGLSEAEAKRRADVWRREDAEQEARLLEQGRRQREAEAARAAEAERRAKEEAAQRAELQAKPYGFVGEFKAGDSSCANQIEFRFADIRSLAKDCSGCSCSFDSRRGKDGTTWIAQCKHGAGAKDTRRLFVGVDFNAGQGDQLLWHATYERDAVTPKPQRCAYVGSMDDTIGRWQSDETAFTDEHTAPAYDLTEKPH